MNNRRLNATLFALVRQYGIGTVLKSLGEIASSDVESSPPEIGGVVRGARQRVERVRPKITAMTYVARMNLSPQRQRTLEEIAERYDLRAFLPTFGDISRFCQSHGIDVPLSRTRANAIPRIFKFLAWEMEIGEIQRILDDGMFSGPSRLGPIADAIRRNGRASGNEELQTPASERASSKMRRTSSGDSASA